ncbi:MAG TPA: helix-turn-helix transcriptional regulator [Ktedonobacterales bacterium]|nr:helix-turn-helix transcriptional regulator [Ktedonobacterales bacterium]
MTKMTAAQRDPLMQAKMELAAANTDGRKGALAAALAKYPTYAEELTTFYASLLATQGYDDAPLTPAIEAIAERASARAFASVFGAAIATSEQAAPVAATVQASEASPAPVPTLKAIRQARHKSLREVARGLGLGVDVLSALEAGRIRASTVPARLLQRLSALLDTATEQLQVILAAPAQAPALLRSRQGERKDGDASEELSFDDAVRLSAEMSAEEKSAWLAAE